MHYGALAVLAASLAASPLAAKTYRARIMSDKKAGKAPHSCPLKKGAMTSGELMKHFSTYPVSRRSSTTVRMAFFDLMKKKYPC